MKRARSHSPSPLPAGVEPIAVELGEDVLADLYDRVRRARLPSEMMVVGRESADRLRCAAQVVRYWVNGFDWRAQEARLNRLPHFRTELDGIRVHFVWLRSPRRAAAPLLLTNGWPSCFLEYVDVLEPLARGTGGGESIDFDVVVPTTPGFGLSDPALDRYIDEDVVADLWLELMQRLGYHRFYAHGDDFGGRIVSRIAWRHPAAVAGLHVTECLGPDRASLPDLAPVELEYLESLERWRGHERAYGAVAATRPQTLALALDDSPLGLAAWLTDKYLSWSDPATVAVWTPDRILGFVTLYWATRSIGPSMRLYANRASPVPTHPVVLAPTAAVAPRESRPAPPRERVERSYADLRVHGRRDRGGHFMAIEHPDGFVDELRGFFGHLEGP